MNVYIEQNMKESMEENIGKEMMTRIFSSTTFKDYMYVVRTMKKLGISRLKDPSNVHVGKFKNVVRNLEFSYYIDGVDISAYRPEKFDTAISIHNLKLLLERKKAFQEIEYDEDYKDVSFLDTYHPCYNIAYPPKW